MLKRQSHIFVTTAVLFDALFASTGWMFCYAARFHLGILSAGQTSPPGAGEFAQLLPVVVLCTLLAVAHVGLYRLGGSRTLLNDCMLVMKAALIAWVAMFPVLYFARSHPYSRKLLVLFLVVSPIALIFSRTLLRWLFRAAGKGTAGWQTAAIIGTERIAQELFERLRNEPRFGVRVEYFLADGDEDRPREVCGLEVAGSAEDLISCLAQRPVDMVFVALSSRHAGKVERILEDLAKSPVMVAVVPDFLSVATLNASVGELGGLPVIQLRASPIEGWHAVVKRALDVAGSIIGIILLSWLMLPIALIIKLSGRGPVFYRQERMGFGGRPFVMLKFRSMVSGAEGESGPVWTQAGDPRRTGFGALLRKTSLDETPQLFNVLRGDMSLVGPRPERPHFARQFADEVPAYMLRYNVKAGMTGWAQVNGLRGNTSLRKRLQYDLYYINHWSLGFDVFILLLTPFRGLVGKNAY